MNNTIFSPFNQPGTLEKADAKGVEEKKRPRQELAVAPKVAAMVNLLNKYQRDAILQIL